MAKATKNITTPTQLRSKEFRSKIGKGIQAAAGGSRRPRSSGGAAPMPTEDVQISTYVYEIRVDGVVRYIGKGRNGRMYSHMIEARRTANKPGVKIANLSPHFRKMLVRAIRRGANIKEKVITADLTDDAAYAIEHHMIGSFHKNHPGQLWNTIDERFMSPEYLPDDWSNPVHPLYKVHRPLTPIKSFGEDQPRFFGQAISPNASWKVKFYSLSRLAFGHRYAKYHWSYHLRHSRCSRQLSRRLRGVGVPNICLWVGDGYLSTSFGLTTPIGNEKFRKTCIYQKVLSR
jgi:hypothetical protein